MANNIITQPPAETTMRSLPEYQASSPPPRYKMALLTWFAAFPTLTVVAFLLGPWVNPLSLVLRALILTGLSRQCSHGCSCPF